MQLILIYYSEWPIVSLDLISLLLLFIIIDMCVHIVHSWKDVSFSKHISCWLRLVFLKVKFRHWRVFIC